MKVFTWFRGNFVGKDAYGNKYYQDKKSTRSGGRPRRWVMYNGQDEASKVPAEWHGWLHHTTDTLPADADLPNYGWMRDHRQNLTGTRASYRPKGWCRSGKPEIDKGYIAWQPK